MTRDERIRLQDDIAAWFENSGVDWWTTEQVAKIVRKWIPESSLKTEFQQSKQEFEKRVNLLRGEVEEGIE